MLNPSQPLSELGFSPADAGILAAAGFSSDQPVGSLSVSRLRDGLASSPMGHDAEAVLDRVRTVLRRHHYELPN